MAMAVHVHAGHGYPDIVTDNDGVYITETYKASPASEARTHTVPPRLLALLASQRTLDAIASGGLTLTPGGAASELPAAYALPNFGNYPRARYGFSLDCTLVPGAAKAAAKAGTPLFEASSSSGGARVELSLDADGVATLSLSDSDGTLAQHVTDPVCSRRLSSPGEAHQLTAVADGGPKMLLFLVDGHLCDGGPQGLAHSAASPVAEGPPAGWLLFDPSLRDVSAATSVRAGPGVLLAGLRLYPRALYTSEVRRRAHVYWRWPRVCARGHTPAARVRARGSTWSQTGALSVWRRRSATGEPAYHDDHPTCMIILP